MDRKAVAINGTDIWVQFGNDRSTVSVFIAKVGVMETGIDAEIYRKAGMTDEQILGATLHLVALGFRGGQQVK